ncbi:transposase, partial [Enterococcus faecium]
WETGYILYLAHGKKKAVVFEFMDHVGDEWMSKVEAVACDMNSDFEEAFKGRYPKLDIVYDRFHIIKNFNDKVVSEIRKDEQRRLAEEGSPEAAKLLKNSRYILMSKRSTLVQKDEDARQGKLVSTAGEIFNTPEIKAYGGNEAWYDELLEENKLFFTIDLVKDLLDQAYNSHDEVEMCVRLEGIIDICKATENSHFIWFARLLNNHLRGIYTFAKYGISTGKLEGINNKIKTERRKGYGYPDDEYFFLRLMEISRKAS